MMDPNLFTSQVQVAHWGWTIALFLWLVGLSGMGMFLNAWLRRRTLVYVCTAAAIVGTLLVMSHLTRILNLPFAAFNSLLAMSFNFTSWMFIGICLLVVQCVATLFVSLVEAKILVRGDWARRLVDHPLMNAGLAACGVAVTIYSGFLLTQAVGVTFWNTALIPVLWIISGMASAFGVIELIDLKTAGAAHWTHRAALWVEVAELIALFSLVHVASSSVSDAARAGAASLLSGDASMLFWVGAVGCGVLVPMVVRLLTKNRALSALAAVLAVLGALSLRAAVLFAGYYEPTLL